jgi:hypothetical protein
MPRGYSNNGVKIINGRSAAQRAQAKQYTQTVIAQSVHKAKAAQVCCTQAPASSWWTEAPTREAFHDAQKKQMARMSISTYGRVSMTGEFL